jgi:DNA-binding MarR family transcriptional regulator
MRANAMKLARKKQVGQPQDPSRDPGLRTVSAKALLIDGSDRAFRRMIHTLMAITNEVDALRAGYAKLIGISPPQHELLMLIYRTNEGEGITVGDLAGLVKLSSAFVATETNKLSGIGYIEKVADKVDRRRVILRVTTLGREKLAFLSAYQRQVNDVLFGCFNAKEFRNFSEYIDRVLPCSESAAELVMKLAREHEASTQVSILSRKKADFT